MKERRVVGLDLGIASAHAAVVLRADSTEVCRRRCSPTGESFAEVERAALEGAAKGTRLEIVVEPTGPAWLPVAVHFGRRGHAVYRIPSAKAADLRRFLSRHARSNSIDAATLTPGLGGPQGAPTGRAPRCGPSPARPPGAGGQPADARGGEAQGPDQGPGARAPCRPAFLPGTSVGPTPPCWSATPTRTSCSGRGRPGSPR